MSIDGQQRKAITVSEELLRAVLAEFKLELFQDLRNYATQVAVDSLSSAMSTAIDGLSIRVSSLERQQAVDEGGDARGRQVSARTLAWAAVAATILGGIITVLISRYNH